MVLWEEGATISFVYAESSICPILFCKFFSLSCPEKNL